MHSVRDGYRFVVLCDGDLLKRFEVLFNSTPCEGVTGFLQTALQFLSQNEREETAEDMPLDVSSRR